MILDGATQIAKAIADFGPLAAKEWRRLASFEAYFAGTHRKPYQPKEATREFNELARRSTTNLTRLIVRTLTQRLVVDGFRSSATTVTDAPQWSWWQANGLDARQKALYDEAAKHGYAGLMVLPGDKDAPVMRPVSAREWFLSFETYDDDWPQLALKQAEDAVWHVLDGRARYVVRTDRGADVAIVEENVHGLGEVPIVPFRNEWALTRYPLGEVEPAITIQDRLNQTVFDLLVAQAYAAAPQKFVAGLVAPTDEATGDPIIDLTAFAASIWASSDPNTKFGSLPEANLSNIVEAIEQCLRVYGLMTQTPPHYLLGDLVNLPLALDTPVPTPTGMSSIGALAIGDQVLDPDGSAVEVIGKSPVYDDHDCYRMRFDDGTEIVADAEHRWQTTHFTSWNAPYRHPRETSVLTTRQIAETLRTKAETFNHYIDVAAPYDGPEADFAIPPYVLGAWLGDGDRVNGIITEGAGDAEPLAQLLRDCGEIVTVRPYRDEAHVNCRLITIRHDPQRGPSFRARLKAAGLWKNKHIPEAYFQGSLKQRLALLQGLMDTDGSTTPGGTVTFTSHDEGLAQDVCRLIRSVGHKVALRQSTSTTFDKTGTVPCWRMAWSATSPVFRLERKAARQRTDFGGGDGRSNTPLRHYIVACERCEAVPVQCIKVNSARHLFVLGEARITTCNSAEALLAADTTLAKKVVDHQTLFGESWEQAFRMGGVAMGDNAAATDTDAQVWWRETEPRSIAQQVDALGKLATMLGVPVQALWQEVPGMTGGTLQLWRAEAARAKFDLTRLALAQRVAGAAPGGATQPAITVGGTPGNNVQRAQAQGAA